MNKKIKLWHITSEKNWLIFQNRGRIYADGKYLLKELKFAYKWMANQMTERLGPGNSYPVWAWYQYNNHKKRIPDLRSSGHLGKGTKGVRLEFWMYQNEILLSDFSLWHYPLNNIYLGDDDKIEKEINKYLHTNKPPEIQRKIEESWCKIFNLKRKTNKIIQATMWEIPIDRIVDKIFFIAR